MKWLEIKDVVNRSSVSLQLGCSKCNAGIYGWEKFCPHCGHKLKELPGEVQMSDVIEALNSQAKVIKKFET